MKSLLIVTTVPDTLRAFLLPFANYFRTQGWQVDAMAHQVSNDADCVAAFNKVWDVEWSRNPLDPKNLIAAPSRIKEVVNQGKYDIVHVHTPVAAFVTRYALKSLRKQIGTKVLYTAHGFHFYRGGKFVKNLVFLALEKLAGSWTDYLVVINHEDEQAAKNYRFLPPEQVFYMPGIGVNLSHYNHSHVSDLEVVNIRQNLNLSTDTPLFLSVAELIPRKHPQDILKAFSKLPHTNAHLAFAGEENTLLRKKMQQLAANLGIKNRVHWLGFRQDIPALIRVSVATILASEQEGLPRSVMESLCLEIPVIGTDIRGTRDLLQGGCGLLVKLEDINGLAKAMAWILDNPEDAQVMGKLGRKQMRIHEINHVLKLQENLYTKALQEQDLYALAID